MQVNVVIKSTTAITNKTLKTTLTYVNPEATNAKLSELAQAMNALTTNSYLSATKETKGDVL